MTIDAGSIEFLEKLNEDVSLQSELASVLEGAQDKTGAVVSFAASKGIQVDRDGFDAARATIAGALEGSEALGEAELESVAGGFNPQPEPPAKLSAFVVKVRPVMKSLILSW